VGKGEKSGGKDGTTPHSFGILSGKTLTLIWLRQGHRSIPYMTTTAAKTTATASQLTSNNKMQSRYPQMLPRDAPFLKQQGISGNRNIKSTQTPPILRTLRTSKARFQRFWFERLASVHASIKWLSVKFNGCWERLKSTAAKACSRKNGTPAYVKDTNYIYK